MQKNKMFNFDYSYLSLPNTFYSNTAINRFPKPEVLIINKKLCNKLNLDFNIKDDLTNLLLKKDKYDSSFSQAYAGHQFGHFTKLGDGRAIIIGEHVSRDNQRYDFQLKGSGKTRYSRNGDGKATLKSMLREYLFSEAMYYLNIPSSRSLALIKTGEYIYRQNKQQGGILARVMKSHIRVGTFEYASYFCSKNELNLLTSYTVNRLQNGVHEYKNPPLNLLNKVMRTQIDLIVNWMRVGFIHGVMNTDNTSITGETFDYGPCAFINTYNPATTYSSIDQNQRYAFGNQPKMIKWNILRFAESLLPIIHHDKETSLKLAKSIIDQFDELWETKYYGMMLKKIGIKENNKTLYPLIKELLFFMKKNNKDYNNMFYSLSKYHLSTNEEMNHSEFIKWKKKWRYNLEKKSSIKQAKLLMRKHNPIIIPRNHIVEEVIEKAMSGNIHSFLKYLNIISKPYNMREGLNIFMTPPDKNFEKNFKTHCGT